MAVKVIMPQLGESVFEGTLSRWLKSPGEIVGEFEPLVEINTDKVDTEVPSPSAGVLMEVLVPEGTVVQVGTLLAWIGQPGEDFKGNAAVAALEKQAIPTRAPAEQDKSTDLLFPGSRRTRELGFISPVVAKMALEHKIDLLEVKGTGQGGRITKRDVEAYLDERSQASDQSTGMATSLKVPDKPGVSSVKASEASGELFTLNPLRRQIAEHMLRSKHTSPHVTTIMEVDLSRVIAHRQANKVTYARDGVNLTFTAYFIAAAVAALKAYPLVNSSWTDAGIRLHKRIHVGMATSLGEAGLIVPVIKNADGLSLLGIARAVNDLANRARARQLVPDEVQGGTFTITNHGVSGSLFATPIINQPQCAILGVGVIQKRAVVISDESLGDAIAIRTMVYLGLTFDHRILDGAIADYFLAQVVLTLQNWI